MHVLFWGLGFLLFPDFLSVVASTGTLLLNSSTGKVCDKPGVPLPRGGHFERGGQRMNEFGSGHMSCSAFLTIWKSAPAALSLFLVTLYSDALSPSKPTGETLMCLSLSVD